MNKSMQWIRRILVRGVLWLVGMIVLMMVLTAVFRSHKPDAVLAQAVQSDDVVQRIYPVFVVRHRWHTGLIVPVSHLNVLVPSLSQRFPDAVYYEIGWGDQGFYQTPQVTAGLALQAMFWSPGTVLHVVAVPASPAKYFRSSEVVQTCLTQQEIASFTQFLSNSFTRDAQGQTVQLQKGLYGDSQFYQGEGDYHWLNTCNKWTTKGLLSAGMDVSPALSLTAESTMKKVRLLQQPCDASSLAALTSTNRF